MRTQRSIDFTEKTLDYMERKQILRDELEKLKRKKKSLFGISSSGMKRIEQIKMELHEIRQDIQNIINNDQS